MFTINERPFINLDNFLDSRKIDDLHYRFCHSIAKSMYASEPLTITGSELKLNKTYPDAAELLKTSLPSDKMFQSLKDETLDTKLNYIKYAYPCITHSRKLHIRKPIVNFQMLHSEMHNYNTEIYDNFKYFVEIIKDMNIFSEIGRMIVYLTDRNIEVETHLNYIDSHTQRCEFIWINPRKNKKFFIMDSFKNKYYIDGTINIFDDANWHGGDSQPTATYSLRVDGKFSDSFLNDTNLFFHYRKERAA